MNKLMNMKIIKIMYNRIKLNDELQQKKIIQKYI